MLLQMAMFYFFFLRLNNILHLLNPFICQWTFRLLPCLAAVNSAAMNKWGTNIFSYYSLCLFQIYAQQWNCQIIGQLYFSFLKKLPYYSAQEQQKFTLPPTVQKGFTFSTPSPAFIICRLFEDGHSDQCEVILHGFRLHFSNNQ